MCSILLKFGAFCVLGALILTWVPNIPPNVNFTAYSLEKPLVHEEILKENSFLEYSEKLYNGYVNSPESIASKSSNEIFTSSRDGSIMRIWGKNWENSEVVTKISPKGINCENYWDEHKCGRSLGLRFNKAGTLFAVHSNMGLFSIDVKTGKQQSLFDPSEAVGGFVPRTFNDLDIDSEGNVYWSDTSHICNIPDGMLAMLSDPSGRLVKYDPKTKKNSVLLSDLAYANGVQLSPDQTFVLVSETSKFRITRYWLKGPKKGKSDVFISGLPGNPDNIRAKKSGGYYIPLVATNMPSDLFDFNSFMAQSPNIRRLIVRSQYGLKSAVDGINSLLSCTLLDKLSHHILNLEVVAGITPPNSIIIEADEFGRVDGTLQGTSVRFISQVCEVDGDLFLGSPYNSYI